MIMIMIMIIMIIITIIIIMNMIISPNITFRNNVQACNTDSVVWFACDNPGLRMAHRKGSESRPHRPARGTQASRSGNLWNIPVGNVQKLGSMGIMILKKQLAFGLPLLLGYGSGNVKIAWTTKRTMTYHDHATTHNLWFERVQVFGTKLMAPIGQTCLPGDKNRSAMPWVALVNHITPALGSSGSGQFLWWGASFSSLGHSEWTKSLATAALKNSKRCGGGRVWR
jgi:hypothetical protein